jgi:hypothetical protein
MSQTPATKTKENQRFATARSSAVRQECDIDRPPTPPGRPRLTPM